MKRKFHRSMGMQVMALIGGLSVACSTYAQSATTKTDADPVLEEVVISGTRIERSGFTAPTPTTSLGAEDFELRAAPNVSAVLFTLPAIRPTITATTGGQVGLTAINLRNLGSNRTLVMADSKRIVGSTVDGVVDSNVIPSALVERVEVVTGGASAAWGSDAVAGVVNFIFKKKIEGFQGSVQYGQAERGDTRNTTASLAWGTSYAADRGQLVIATEYSATRDLPKMDDRDWSKSHWGFVTANGITNQSATGVTLSNLAAGGVIVGGVGNGGLPVAALRGIQFGAGSTVQPFTYGSNYSGNFMVGGSGDYYLDEISSSPNVKRNSVYLRTSFDFTDQLQGIAETSLFESEGSITFLPLYAPNVDGQFITIRNDNGYLQTLPGLAPLRTIVAANGITSFNIGRVMHELGPTHFNNDVTTKRYLVGLNGKLGDSYKWQAYAQKGRTNIEVTNSNLLNAANFAASMDTIVGAGGQVVCRKNITTPLPTALTSLAAPGCVPGNPFGVGSLTTDVKNYVTGNATSFYNLQQDTAGLQAQGDVFSTWAGKVSLVVGGEYRKESIDGGSDPLSQQRRPNGTLGLWQFGSAQPLAGSYTVKELFAETVVPLAHDLPFAQALDLNAAARHTDYSTAGKVTTSKLGLTYRPLQQLLLRGTVSKDIRAPNLNELFQTGAGQSFNASDPGVLTNGAPTPYTTAQLAVGNPSLTPEKADTKTFGLAWTPDYISGFKASVDYYEIDIKDAIASVTAQQLVNGCFGVAGFAPTASFCRQISRDPATGLITQVRTSPVNFQSIFTKGIDYELSYRLPINVVGGNLTVRGLATNIRSYITNTGTSSIDRVGEIIGIGSRTPTYSPRWRGSLTGSWNKDAWTVFLETRYMGGGKYDVAAKPTDIDNNNVPAVIYLATSVSYDVISEGRRNLQVFFKVNNLLDRDPPITLTNNQNNLPANAGLYDVIGRTYVLGTRFSF